MIVTLWSLSAAFEDMPHFKNQFAQSLIAHLKQETLNLFFSLVFCNYVILGGHILNISKMFPKLIFYLQLSYQLSDVLLKEFHIHSTCVIYYSIQSNFNVIIKTNQSFLLRHTRVREFTFITFEFQKKIKFIYY